MRGAPIAILLAAACAAPAGAPSAPPAAGWHGVVVDPAGGALRVSFAPDWAPADGVPGWAFAGAPAGGGWTAFGRLAGDSLWWGVARIEGDAGSARSFAGRVEADGSVRGCEVAPGGGRWRPAGAGGRAFILRPRTAPLPAAVDAPAGACPRSSEEAP